MPRTVCIIQARMTSSRLPGKVMLPLAGQPLVSRVVERVKRTSGIDLICLAIPEGEPHAPLAKLAKESGWPVVTGPEHDVLKRYRMAADFTQADTVMRVTSDCPLIDPGVCGAVLAMNLAQSADYSRTALQTGFPLGLDLEIMSAHALRAADDEAQDPYEREHVSPFIDRRPERFGCQILDRRPDRRNWRLTVDEIDDYRVAEVIYNEAFPAQPAFDFAWLEQLLLSRPNILAINQHIIKPIEKV